MIDLVLENEQRLKEVFKIAIVEVLSERKELVQEIFSEIVEDIAFARALAAGENTPVVSRSQVFELLETTN